MEQVTITVTLDPLRLEALEYFLKQEGSSVQKQMDEALRKLYEEKVPETMRGYLDWKIAPNSKAKRPSRSMSRSQAESSSVTDKNEFKEGQI